MRILDNEEIDETENSWWSRGRREFFDSIKIHTEEGEDRAYMRWFLKAQHQQGLKDVIHLIEVGVADGKWLSDIIGELKELAEEAK